MTTKDFILHVTGFEIRGPYCLRLAFNDGTSKSVNALPLLEGEVFEPLSNPDFFAQASLDEVFGVIGWHNGADFAPEALYELPDIGESVLPPKDLRRTFNHERKRSSLQDAL